MKKIIKDALALTAITVVIGLLLGLVSEVTKEPIARQEEKAKEEACAAVFPEASGFTPLELGDVQAQIEEELTAAGCRAQTIDEAAVALDGSGAVLGYVITVTSGEGYGGDIQFSMGVAADGTVTGLEFLSISETAGLGMKADTEQFKGQYAGKKTEAFQYSKTGASGEDEIDALSGATVTTNAVTNGVNAGLAAYRVLAQEGGDQ